MAETETIRIETPTGLRLAGVLHHPQIENNGMGMVVAHGMLSSKDSDKHISICEAVAAHGATALRFDFRGRGESGGDPSILTVSNEIEDFATAISFVRDCGYSRVMAAGSSLGGSVAILAGARDLNLDGLISIAAPARLPDEPREAWGGSGMETADRRVEVAPGEFIDGGFFLDAARHDVIRAARSMDCPWLIIHGAADEVVSVDDAALFVAANPTADLKIHPTAGHRFERPEERKWLIERVSGFVADHR